MTDRLSFEELRHANVPRCRDSFHQELDDWNPLEWAGAIAGEVGEAANKCKKWRRQQHGDASRGALEDEIMDELADTVIYVDLLAARLGRDLGAAVRSKFNRKSDEIGSPIKLVELGHG